MLHLKWIWKQIPPLYSLVDSLHTKTLTRKTRLTPDVWLFRCKIVVHYGIDRCHLGLVLQS